MTKSEFEKEKIEIMRWGENQQRKSELRKLRRSYKAKPKMETNKKIAIFILVAIAVNSVALEVFAGYLMLRWGNLDSLSTLLNIGLGGVIAALLDYGIYSAKAHLGKKEEENLKFEREKMEYEYKNRMGDE